MKLEERLRAVTQMADGPERDHELKSIGNLTRQHKHRAKIRQIKADGFQDVAPFYVQHIKTGIRFKITGLHRETGYMRGVLRYRSGLREHFRMKVLSPQLVMRI